MPLPEGTRYGVMTTKTGKKVRLAFAKGSAKKGARPIEAKNLKTGATHTPAEFAAERASPHKLSGRAKRGRF